MAKILRLQMRMSPPEMICEYCRHWIEAERFGFQDQDNDEDLEPEKQIRRKTAGTRKCRMVGKDIGNRSPSCIDFDVNRDFWCHRNSQYYDVVVCIARQRKAFENCPGCSQGRLLWKYICFKNIEAITKEDNNGL